MTGENRQQTADDSRHKNEECIPQGSGHGTRVKRHRMVKEDTRVRIQSAELRRQTTDDREQKKALRMKM